MAEQYAKPGATVRLKSFPGPTVPLVSFFHVSLFRLCYSIMTKMTRMSQTRMEQNIPYILIPSNLFVRFHFFVFHFALSDSRFETFVRLI